MKDSSQNRKIKCDNIEDLLIKQNIENLSAEESDLLHKHLKACKHCQSYQHELAYIQRSMLMDQKNPLKPDPAIRQIVTKQMLRRKPGQQGLLNSFWQWLLNFLDYRIPVYQGLFGIACGLFIFALIHYFPLPDQSVMKHSPYQLQIADTTLYQINVIKNLQIIEQQKIGKNVSEDSVLTRFIVKAM